MSLQEASFAEGTPRPVQVEKRADLVGQRDGLLQEIDGRPILLVLQFNDSQRIQNDRAHREVTRPEQMGRRLLPECSFLRSRRCHDAQGFRARAQ